MKRIFAIVAIFIGVTIAWMSLASSVDNRTVRQDEVLKEEVGQLWGASQRQKAPQVWNRVTTQEEVSVIKSGKNLTETKTVTTDNYWPINASKIKVDLDLDHRKKGLLWYSTYRVNFDSEYKIANPTEKTTAMFLDFEFPNNESVYDNFQFMIGNQKVEDVKIKYGKVRAAF